MVTRFLSPCVLLLLLPLVACGNEDDQRPDAGGGAGGSLSLDSARAGASGVVPPACFILFPDGDGDGYGTGDGSCWEEAGVAGMARLGQDCDDENSEISPASPEQWRDGIDSNCDREHADDPIDCEARPTMCGCAELAVAPERVELDESCTAADLVLRSAEQCRVCGSPWVAVVVANRGQVEAQNVVIELKVDEMELAPYLLGEPLAPGAVSLPINVFVPHGTLSLLVRADTECNPSDNASKLSLFYANCK